MKLLTIALLSLFVSVSADAASIQARLIRATADATQTDQNLKDIEPQLKKQFGYPHYQLLGEKKAGLDSTQKRLDLGEGFVFFVKELSVENKSHKLEAVWTSGQVSIVKTEVEIPESKSLFIKGPEVGSDWIILALTVTE